MAVADVVKGALRVYKHTLKIQGFSESPKPQNSNNKLSAT
jgi:hypothetical protein